jgi:hypothetical protein
LFPLLTGNSDNNFQTKLNAIKEISQLQRLFQENWIAIDRSKRGPSNHKAFLTKEGKKIIQDPYVFTPENKGF